MRVCVCACARKHVCLSVRSGGVWRKLRLLEGCKECIDCREARSILIWCIYMYGTVGNEITKYTVYIYGVYTKNHHIDDIYTRFWPTVVDWYVDDLMQRVCR